MLRKRKERKGSMIVEAAIVLPVYIIAVVTLCWLVRACFLQTAVFSTVTNEIHETSVSLAGSAGLKHNIRAALDSSGIEGGGYSQKIIETGLTVIGVDGFERLTCTYDTEIRIPIPFVKKIELENVVLYHPWTGSSPEGEALSFTDMEREGEGRPVVIFPRSGERYHTTSCRYANARPEEVTLTEEIRRKYGRCRNCTEGDERNGQTVYIFKYGGSYHEADCSAVDKFTMTMDLEDAGEKGYTACSICGGGD
ncbi:MAG: hypothetical protein IKD86_01810 [Firmicutes bacterium]|nr:hypothetical protein [Bacillota bacterium]